MIRWEWEQVSLQSSANADCDDKQVREKEVYVSVCMCVCVCVCVWESVCTTECEREANPDHDTWFLCELFNKLCCVEALNVCVHECKSYFRKHLIFSIKIIWLYCVHCRHILDWQPLQPNMYDLCILYSGKITLNPLNGKKNYYRHECSLPPCMHWFQRTF